MAQAERIKERESMGVAGISQKVAAGIPPDAPSTLVRVWRLGQAAHYDTGFGRVQNGLAHTRPTLSPRHRHHDD
jgi:hypothetical protein